MMPAESRQLMLTVITVAVIGFMIGNFVSRTSWEAEKREGSLAGKPPVTVSGNRSNALSFRKRGASSGTLLGTGDSRSIDWEWVEDPRTREFFTQIDLTKEDWERVQQMERRRAQGEYILQNERPSTRKFLDHDFGEIVSRAAAARAAEYDQVFAQLGVGAETAEQLKTHLAKIHRAALEANVAIQQVVQARQDYDSRLRSTMNEQNYVDYRQFEEAKLARREYRMFRSFAEQQNIAVDPAHEQALTSLIQASQAYTSKSYFGPYDGLPQPMFGIENVIPATERQIDEITGRANQILSWTAEAGLPDNYRNLLASYYAEKVHEKKREIEALKSSVRPNGLAR